MAWMVEQQRLLTAGVNGNDGCELWVSEGFESSTQFCSTSIRVGMPYQVSTLD